MIRASVVAGALSVNASKDRIDALAGYADKIGLAFQVVDDILNIEGNPDVMGKAQGSDALMQKMTFPALIGLDASKKYARTLIKEACDCLSLFDSDASAPAADDRAIHSGSRPMTLLETVNTEKNIKSLSRKELAILAREVRERIIQVVSKNGGHLASSLGAVELTLAIHHVFDLPADTLIWDVGHQSYAHKLLTGRNDAFDTLRQHKGLSGFCKIKESPCDGFTVGHSSTSISAGLGVSCAKYLNKDNSDVISVIGDGSLTAGLAYEGLNQTGDTKRNLIVILNDNDMSISRNVGALSSFLSRTFSARHLQRNAQPVRCFFKVSAQNRR